MNNSVLFVDICDTLYPENTTVGFVYYVMESNGIKLNSYFSSKILKSINSVVYKVFNIDLFRYFLISKLEGFSKKELEYYAESYICTLQKNKRVSKIIDNYIIKGFDIEFHSASLEPVVQAVSNIYMAKHYSASLLSYNNNRCEGKMKLDMLGNKKIEIYKSSKKYNFSVFITDNKSDYSCYEYCDKFIAVIPKGKTSVFWEKKDVEFVNL
ncbi:hypothetical protein [Photobacterium phosphoreum]|uniref:hypothetical protein n=1 Tax=Photobacterium phosphoreum TaxID=659 RepID=UPI0039B1000D